MFSLRAIADGSCLARNEPIEKCYRKEYGLSATQAPVRNAYVTHKQEKEHRHTKKAHNTYHLNCSSLVAVHRVRYTYQMSVNFVERANFYYYYYAHRTL